MSVPQNSFELDQNAFSLSLSILSYCPLILEHLSQFEVKCVAFRPHLFSALEWKPQEVRDQVCLALSKLPVPCLGLDTQRSQKNLGKCLDHFSELNNFPHVPTLCFNEILCSLMSGTVSSTSQHSPQCSADLWLIAHADKPWCPQEHKHISYHSTAAVSLSCCSGRKINGDRVPNYPRGFSSLEYTSALLTILRWSLVAKYCKLQVFFGGWEVG